MLDRAIDHAQHVMEERVPEALVKYTITLQFAARATDGHMPKGKGRRKAIDAAKAYSVTNWNGGPIKDGVDITPISGGAQWKVKGTPTNVCKMVCYWTHPPQTPTAPNVTVTNIVVDGTGALLNCFPCP